MKTLATQSCPSHEAALPLYAEINRLAAENARLRVALLLIANAEELHTDSFVCDFSTLQCVAEQALRSKASVGG